MIPAPMPGQFVLLANQRVRVVGDFPSDPKRVPVQDECGHLLLVQVTDLEEEFPPIELDDDPDYLAQNAESRGGYGLTDDQRADDPRHGQGDR